MNIDLASTLLTSGSEPDVPLLFERFTGSWHVRNRYRPSADDEWTETDRTWIFAQILEGRAVQDVILGSDRGGDQVAAGATVRAYDPALAAWRVQWFGTLHADFASLIARPHGDDGVRQDGVEHRPGGDVPIRWNFSRILEGSFAWDGWSSADGGDTWWLEQHMDAQRAD